MTFDNSKTIIALRLRVFLATVLLLVYIYLVYFGKELEFPLLGLESGVWTLIILSLYTFLSFYPLLFKYKYFYFSDDGPNIVIKYYPIGLFGGKKSAIEIPKKEFLGYKIERYMVVFKSIIISRKMDRRTALYPVIHLGSLRLKEINKLTDSLDSYSARK